VIACFLVFGELFEGGVQRLPRADQRHFVDDHHAPGIERDAPV
jgi:hypothetical protein